jgi:hypothetical protein
MSKKSNNDLDISALLKLSKPKRYDPQEEAYEELVDFADKILEEIGDEPLGHFIRTKGSDIVTDADIAEFIKIIENPFIKYSLFQEEIAKLKLQLQKENILEVEKKMENLQIELYTELYTFKKNDNVEMKSNDFYKEIIMKGTKYKNIHMSNNQRAVIKILLDLYVAKNLNDLYHRLNQQKKQTLKNKRNYKYRPGAKSLPTRLRTKSKSKSKSKSKRKSKYIRKSKSARNTKSI